MAKTDKDAGATAEGQTEAKPTGAGGRAIVLPNGKRRIDYIRDRYYTDGASRSDIKNEINTMLKEDGQETEIAYQIVFGATKTKEDPRKAKPAEAAEAPKEG